MKIENVNIQSVVRKKQKKSALKKMKFILASEKHEYRMKNTSIEIISLISQTKTIIFFFSVHQPLENICLMGIKWNMLISS